MSYEPLIHLLDEMASDYMFLEQKEVDIIAAGKFMNSLEKAANQASELNIGFIIDVANWLNTLLEHIVLDQIQDKNGGFLALGEGIKLLQSIADGHANSGKHRGDITCFGDKISSLTGVSVVEKKDTSPVPASGMPNNERAKQKDANTSIKDKETNQTKTSPSDESQIQDESLLRDFIVEGLEYIEQIEVNILNLEKNPEDKNYINAIFRPFHSIKGVASFLNLDKIRDLAHELENLLDKARNNELAVTQPVIDVVLEGADVLKLIITELNGRLEGNISEETDFDISSLVKRIELVGKGKQDSAGVANIGQIFLEEGYITPEDLDKGLKIKEANPNKKLGEVLISEGKLTPKQVSNALRRQSEMAAEISSIRVDTRKLDDLIDIVGELVINQSMVQQDIKNLSNMDRNLIRDIGQLSRIVSSLQRLSTGLRMVPIKQTFQRMSRLVRDLGRSNGKSITVELVGEDTEIDRNMVEEIYNPLVHMVRNSVDHGLETPDERVRSGKRPEGLIRLRAYHRGGSVIIEITDDGRGLDRGKILDKAMKSGVITSGEGLSEQDIYKLIFVPGLSTAEKVTDVSGRGVGMDVVKQAVGKLRGKIDIESVAGKGSTFFVSFPLTLAIIDGMIVKVGPQYYIIPITAVRQALRPRKEDCISVAGGGEMISATNQLFPLVRLHKLFGIVPEKETPWDAIVLIMESENRLKCLLVDKIIGKAEVVIKNLGRTGKVQGVSGGAILGDGRVGLIIDTEGIFEMSEAL
jgi:two-component system, chemotaxis family, sensor kinase CheA